MNGLSLRFELFTDDPQRSVTFYTQILGFEVIRHSEKYDSLKRGSVIIGIGSAHKLIDNHYFRPEVITARKGLGV